MTLDEIKAAVRAGKKVFWKTDCYEVRTTPSGQTWLIVYVWSPDDTIGLTWLDGVTVNGRPEEFYTK